MRKLIAVIAAVCLTSSTPVAAKHEPFAHNPASIVKVECKEGTGSATRVGPNKYLSVNHVTSLTECKVDGTPIRVTYNNKEQDFSIFVGPYGTSVMPISCEGFKQMHPYVMRGYAFGDDVPWYAPVIAVGSYGGFSTFVGEDYPGMSGGPVIDEEGRTTGTVNIGHPTGSVDLSKTVVCKGK